MRSPLFPIKSRYPVLIFLFISFFMTGTIMAGQVSDQGDVDISAVVPSNAPPSGGGGGSGSSQFVTVSLSGFTFPNAKLTLLKDGVVTTTLIANSDGSFQITVNNLTLGNYQFSIYAEDPNGIISSPYVVNINALLTRPYVISGIVVPPTLTLSSPIVMVGQEFTARGFVAPGATVTLDIPNNQSLGTVVADGNGRYEFIIRAALPPGTYELRSRATVNAVNSLYSRPVQISVYGPGQLPPKPPTQLGQCVDYNRDNRVNLIDFSILLYWFGKVPPPPGIDCNQDHVIDMKDFSILMYYWTG